MPVLDPLTDPRFAGLISELRDARIAAPETLTDRVDTFLARAASEPAVLDKTWHARLRRTVPKPPHLRLPPLRWLAIAAMAVAGVAIAYGVVTGPGTNSSSSFSAASSSPTPSASTPASSSSAAALSSTVAQATPPPSPVSMPKRQPRAPGGDARVPTSTLGAVQRPGAVPPTPGRYQQYAARIRINVPSVQRLSDVTARVITITDALGGYVLSVAYGQATAKHGGSYLDVKIPVGRVQTAIERFSGLGTIASEHVSIQDEQGTVDALAARISDLELRVAQLNAELASPNLPAVDAVTLRFRRAQAQHDLYQARLQRSATIAKASYAEVQVTFAVAAPAVAKKAAGGSSQIGRDARGGLHMLGVVAGTVIYVGIVLLPFTVVAVIVWLSTRNLRRRRDRQVLERA